METRRNEMELEIPRSGAQSEPTSILTDVFEGSLVGIIILDNRFHVAWTNRAIAENFGVPLQELLGAYKPEIVQQKLKFIFEDPEGFASRVLRTYAANDHIEEFECHVLAGETREERWLRHWSQPIAEGLYAGGRVEYYTDITSRKRTEDALRKSEGKHQFLNQFNEAIRGLADAGAIMATAARLIGEHLGVSRCAYADVDPDEERFTIHRDYTKGCSSSQGDYHLSLFGHGAVEDLRSGRSLVLRDVDTELALDDGRMMFNAISVKALICCPLIKEGRLRAMMAVHQNAPRSWSRAEVELVEFAVERCWATIERARAEQALRRSEEQNRLIMEHVKDFAIFSVDVEGHATSWNTGAENIFGYTEEEILGRRMDILFTPEDRAKGAPEQERKTAAEKGCATDERWHLRKNGERFFASGAVRPVRSLSGATKGFIKVARDITGRKRMEDQLREARENLEKTVQQRTSELQSKVVELEAFSYSVSHDLRAPLRAMQGYSQFLLEDYGDKIDETGRNYLSRMIKASERLDRLVQDILTYSRVARAENDNRPIDMDRLIEEVIHGYPSLQSNLVRIEIRRPLHAVLGHEGSLTQCISNLLGNAVKFVPPGRTPHIQVWSDQMDGKVRISFKDNGIGIAREHQSRIFGMFEKAQPNTVYEGTGIGLAIVRKAVERMDGTLGVESEPGLGSTFWIELTKAE